MTEGAGLKRYLVEAFLFRWNLLLFGATTLGGLLSGHADVVVPVVGALELAYLVSLVATERFRELVDQKSRSEANDQDAVRANSLRQSQAESLLATLAPYRAERLARLRQRCLDMRFLARSVGGGETTNEASDYSTAALDRLLWVFLKLLVSQQALQQFLGSTDAAQIAHQLQSFQEKLVATPETDERLRRALTDSVATVELRLSNYEKARRNAEFVEVELDRLEAKIQALTEMSVSHEDPNYISSQVDSIAQSMAETEEEMRELDALTGFVGDEGAPELLDPPTRQRV